MAEGEVQGEKKGINKLLPITNLFKRIGRSIRIPGMSTGFPLHYAPTPGFDIRELPTYKELDKEINFKVIAELNGAMVRAEKNWDGIPSKDTDNAKSKETQESAGFIRDQIIKLYSEPRNRETGTDINSCIGPFTNRDALFAEGDGASGGTGIRRRGETIEIRKHGESIISNFSVPQEIEIAYDEDRRYKIAFFGSRPETYWELINNEIDEICRKVLQKSMEVETDENKKQNINSNIGIANSKIKSLISAIREYEKQFEDGHRSKLIGGSGVLQHWNVAQNLRDQMLKLKLNDEQVVYTHTYKIIKPYYLEDAMETLVKEIQDDGKIITEQVTVKRPVYFNPDKNPYKDELGEINKKLRESGAEDGKENEYIEKVKEWYIGQLTQIGTNLNQANNNVKTLMSKAIKEDFGRILLRDLYKGLDTKYTKKEEEIGNFLREIKKKIIELLTILTHPQLKYFPGLSYSELKEEQYFKIVQTGQFIKDLNDLLTALTTIDKETFEYYVTKEKNDFGEWVNNILGDRDLARAIFEAGTNRDSIVRAVKARLSAISGAQYRQKLNEFFIFIDEKLKELNIKVDSNTKNDFDRLKRTLMQLPIIIDDKTMNEKRALLMQLSYRLYNPKPGESGILKNYIGTMRNELRNFMKELFNKLNELAESREQDLEIKNNELFNLIIDRILGINGVKSNEELKSKKEQLGLEEDKITDEEIKKLKILMKSEQNNFNRAINSREIIQAMKLRRLILLKKEEILGILKWLEEQLLRRATLSEHIKNLKADHPNFKKEDNETDWGFDENGWLLEVGDGTTTYNLGSGRRVFKEGEVLIDIFEGRTPRVVQKEFIEDCDLLDLAIWIYVNYDAYRDDLRDGRYHEKSITVMEHIMTDLNIPDIKHPQSKKDIKDSTHAKITMNLNNPPGRPSSIKMPIEPSAFNPAFDLSVYKTTPTTGKTRHVGRKYYYDTQDNLGITVKQSQEPTITTRGAAMYILHRVIDEVKYWGESSDSNRAGVIQLLKAIGEITDGFDIGPNLGPGFARWGLPLTRNPFEPV